MRVVWLILVLSFVVLAGCTPLRDAPPATAIPPAALQPTPLPAVPGSTLVSGTEALATEVRGEQQLVFTGIISGSASSLSISYKAGGRDMYSVVSVRQQAGKTEREEITRMNEAAWARNPSVNDGAWRALNDQEINRLPPESDEFAGIYLPSGFMQQLLPELAGYPPQPAGNGTINDMPAQKYTLSVSGGNFAGQSFDALNGEYATAEKTGVLLHLNLHITGKGSTTDLRFDYNPATAVAIAPPEGVSVPAPVPVLQALRQVDKLTSYEVTVRSNIQLSAQDASGVITQTQRYAAPDSWEVSSNYVKLGSSATYIRSGNQYWRRDIGQGWQSLESDEASSAEKEFSKLFLVDSTADLLKSFALTSIRQGQSSRTGDETVNGVATHHDQVQLHNTAKNTNQIDSMTLDTWIATQGEYLVKMRLRMSGKDTNIEIDWDLSNPNGTIAIQKPE